MQPCTTSYNNQKGKKYTHDALLLLIWAAYQHLTLQLHTSCLRRRQLAANQVAAPLLHCVTRLPFIMPDKIDSSEVSSILVGCYSYHQLKE